MPRPRHGPRAKSPGADDTEVTTDRKKYTRNQTVQIQVRFPNPGIAPEKGDVNVDVKKKGEGARKVATEVGDLNGELRVRPLEDCQAQP